MGKMSEQKKSKKKIAAILIVAVIATVATILLVKTYMDFQEEGEKIIIESVEVTSLQNGSAGSREELPISMHLSGSISELDNMQTEEYEKFGSPFKRLCEPVEIGEIEGRLSCRYLSDEESKIYSDLDIPKNYIYSTTWEATELGKDDVYRLIELMEKNYGGNESDSGYSSTTAIYGVWGKDDEIMRTLLAHHDYDGTWSVRILSDDLRYIRGWKD